MKQQELEAFVDALAKAEQEAGDRIGKAEAASQARLQQRMKALEDEGRKKLVGIEQDWEVKKQDRLKETEALIAEMGQHTDAILERMKKQHQKISTKLTTWAVKQVTQ